MKNNEFGKYLKMMRIKHKKTQEEVANSIGKSKMLISCMENGKNNPPREEKALFKMMVALELDDEEKIKFRKKALIQNGIFLDNFLKTVKKDERKLDILYMLENNEMSDEKYQKITNLLDTGGDKNV